MPTQPGAGQKEEGRRGRRLDDGGDVDDPGGERQRVFGLRVHRCCRLLREGLFPAQGAAAGRAPRGAMRAGGWLAGNAAAATADAASSTPTWPNLDCVSVLCSPPPAVSVGAEVVVIEHNRWLRSLSSREKSNDY